MPPNYIKNNKGSGKELTKKRRGKKRGVRGELYKSRELYKTTATEKQEGRGTMVTRHQARARLKLYQLL